MAKAIFGNHAAVMVLRRDRDRIRRFYCDVLGCRITREDDTRDFLRMGDDFYIAFLYGDDADESEFLRSGKSIWLEIKSDNTEEMRQKILDFGVRTLDIPDPHLYFQAPGGQVLRLVAIGEDLSNYEGVGKGPNVGTLREAIERNRRHGGLCASRQPPCVPTEDCMPDILHLIKIRVARERVYAALTTAEGIRKWWTRDATLDSSVGGAGAFRFYSGTGLTEVSIEELTPPARVAWKVVSANAPGGWDGTTITFDLRPAEDATVLSFAQRGFAEASEGYALVNTGWAYYLVSLQQYLERGQGAPHPDIDFTRMVA